MSVHRLLGSVFLALAFAAPQAAGAQATSPDALATQTRDYFTAVLHADAGTLAGETSRSFRYVRQNGTQEGYEDFLRDVTRDAFSRQNPMGVTVTIKSSSESGAEAEETVNTMSWWSGALSVDPLSGPVVAHSFATHQLTWSKSADGRWLLDEDHLTALSTF